MLAFLSLLNKYLTAWGHETAVYRGQWSVYSFISPSSRASSLDPHLEAS